jgi:7-carboxy-7-deazaguanine synthase
MSGMTLNVTEIYASIQGESSYAGFPCTFVRLTGCPLRCRWCDTAYAFHGGRSMDIAEIIAEVDRLRLPMVELTGGEPLAQDGTPTLMAALIAKGYQVLIETSGSESLSALPPETHIIMDIKCPGSGMEDRNLWSNLALLKPTDEIKFVLADRADFDWARALVQRERLGERCQLLWSCAWGHTHPKDLAAWMVADIVPGRLQLQQHKYIWGPRAKGV